MSRKIKDDKREGPPSRKSMAGPMLLGTFANLQGAKRGTDEETTVPHHLVKDYQAIDGRIRVTKVVNSEKDILTCKYTENFNLFATGCSDGSCVFNAIIDDEPTQTFTLIDNDILDANAPLTGMLHRPVSKNYPITNTFICTYGNGLIKSWNYNFQQCIYTMKENRECYGITYHPRYAKYITYGDDCKVYLYDEESRTQERVLSSSNSPKVVDGHTSRVFAACFSPRSNYELVTGGWDDVICFWDLRQPYAIRHIFGSHVCGESLDINMRGTEILCGSFQKSNPLQVFDYGSGKLVGKIDSTTEVGKLYAAKYLSKDYAVLGGTQPNTLSVIDLNGFVTVASINGLPSGVFSVDIGAPKKKVANPNDFGALPSMGFVAGKKTYLIDFY